MKSKQNIVIFGATGKVGRLVVEYALADGYHVTAFVHRRSNLPKHPNLRTIHGDIYQRLDVENAIRGADAVLSALGSWGTPKKDVLSSAMANIIPAMNHEKTKRIISLTGAEARADGDELGIIHRVAHFALGIIAGKILRDSERHIALLQESSLDWTVIRSPIMLPSGSQKYQIGDSRPLPWTMVSRRSVARTMVDQISNRLSSRQALFLLK